MIKNLYKEGYTQNRELSWLRFDERCLNEAKDESVPLLERLKFVSIFSSNLDEFFSVRVGSLTDMKQMKAFLNMHLNLQSKLSLFGSPRHTPLTNDKKCCATS